MGTILNEIGFWIKTFMEKSLQVEMGGDSFPFHLELIEYPLRVDCKVDFFLNGKEGHVVQGFSYEVFPRWAVEPSTDPMILTGQLKGNNNLFADYEAYLGSCQFVGHILAKALFRFLTTNGDFYIYLIKDPQFGYLIKQKQVIAGYPLGEHYLEMWKVEGRNFHEAFITASKTLQSIGFEIKNVYFSDEVMDMLISSTIEKKIDHLMVKS